jgi:hypothetical protein
MDTGGKAELAGVTAYMDNNSQKNRRMDEMHQTEQIKWRKPVGRTNKKDEFNKKNKHLGYM